MAFFGRRVGKPLRPFQADALEAALQTLGVDLAEPAPTDLTRLFCAPVGEIVLEIGFGGGEHLAAERRAHPATGFIGVEPFVNGMAKLAAAIAADRPENLRLYNDDATRLLDWLPAAAIDRIDLFYPDPWTKKRHWKRRFVNTANLDRFARILKPGGVFRFASDIDAYVDWTIALCADHASFEPTATHSADWSKPFPGWQGTRYEAKALREGRRPAYLRFVKCAPPANVSTSQAAESP